MSFDLYTNKHTQWFFFSVRNMRKGQTYRFTIINLYKVQTNRQTDCMYMSDTIVRDFLMYVCNNLPIKDRF